MELWRLLATTLADGIYAIQQMLYLMGWPRKRIEGTWQEP